MGAGWSRDDHSDPGVWRSSNVSAVNTATPTSGTQHEIAFGDYRAVIASVGSSLRVLQHNGRDLVVPVSYTHLTLPTILLV